jgi:hypothetical protein
MGMEISRLAALGLAVLVTAAAGCGSTTHPGNTKTGGGTQTGAGGAQTNAGGTQTNAAGFAWLSAAVPPSGWQSARIPSGAAFSYPPGWTRVHGDAGTASVALLNSNNQFLGYLNLTPRQGDETLGNWAHFRVAHNADEGDRAVTTQAATTNRGFRGGHISCVQDSYVTGTGARYVELACLLAGQKGNVVMVGAAPPQSWPNVAPLIKQAISSTTA